MSLKELLDSSAYFPPRKDLLRAFELTPFHKVKAVIIGQDPYHGPGQANGLCFSVNRGCKIPPSLANIYKELASDCGISIPLHGDLTAWAQQGVLLMNSILTVAPDQPLSHKDKGWEALTDQIIVALNNRKQPLVFILWGKHAHNKKSLISNRHLVLTASHPSPLACYRGFFGSQPFSKTNDFLTANNIKEIDWTI